MAMDRLSFLSRLRDGLAALLDLAPPDPADTTGGRGAEREMAAIARCAFAASAACLDQIPPPTGEALRGDAALVDVTAAQLGLTTCEAAALNAALLLTRLDTATRATIATPDAVTSQQARALSLRASTDARPGGALREDEASPAKPTPARPVPATPPIDPLTRLPMLRFLFGSFEQDIRRAEQLGRPLTLIQLDIDDFSTLNERYGRAAGDRVLRGVARAIRSTLRPGDTCVRCAGDEFVITIPGVGEDGVVAVLGRIETAVLRHKFAVARGRTVQVGVTIGAASYPADGQSHEALLAVAEARRLDRLFARRRRPEDADRHLRFPGRPDVPVN